MLRNATSFSLLVAACIIAEGCMSKECTLIGCSSSLEVRFTGATGKPGRYQVEMMADGASATCAITLPWTCETQPTCSAAALPWRLTLAGCALGADRESLDGVLFFEKPPASLEFTVRRDDKVVGGGSAQPVYKESRPNGPDCDPVCRSTPAVAIEIAP